VRATRRALRLVCLIAATASWLLAWGPASVGLAASRPGSGNHAKRRVHARRIHHPARCGRSSHRRRSHARSSHRRRRGHRSRRRALCVPRRHRRHHARQSHRRHPSSKPRHHNQSAGSGSGSAGSQGNGTAAASSGSGSCANGGLAPTEGDREAIREAVLCLVNRERAAHGEGPLKLNEDLDQAAQGHSESMASGGYFEHSGPEGGSFVSRLRAAGYLHGSNLTYDVGENIAWGSLQDATPSAIVAAWMASPGHRANILNPEFRDIGIGVISHLPASFGLGQSGAMYTEDFGVVL
jgi:uncharacterized protein YkwD